MSTVATASRHSRRSLMQVQCLGVAISLRIEMREVAMVGPKYHGTRQTSYGIRAPNSELCDARLANDGKCAQHDGAGQIHYVSATLTHTSRLHVAQGTAQAPFIPFSSHCLLGDGLGL